MPSNRQRILPLPLSLPLDVPLSLWILWATLYIYRLPLLLNCPACQIFKSTCHNHFWLIHLASKATSCLSLCVDRQTAQMRWAPCTACDEGRRHQLPFYLNLFAHFLCPIYYIIALLFLLIPVFAFDLLARNDLNFCSSLRMIPKWSSFQSTQKWNYQ